MPSNAFSIFNSRRSSEVLEIAGIFDQVNNKPGPNMHYGLLNGALVLLVSSWEIYCEEVCQQAMDALALRDGLGFVDLPERMRRDIVIYAGEGFSGGQDPLNEKVAMLPDSGWKRLLQDRLKEFVSDFNTPKFSRQRGKDLNNLFRHVLGIRMSQEVNGLLADENFCEGLDAIVTLRGEIAHTGEAAPENRLTSQLLRQHVSQFLEGAAAVDVIIQRAFRDQLAFAPWQITEPVRANLRENVRVNL